LLKNGPLISLPSSSTLNEALRTLHENAISSIPIYDDSTHVVVGSLNMFDIVVFILRFLGINAATDLQNISGSIFEALSIPESTLGSVSLAAILQFSESDPSKPLFILPTASLYELITLFNEGVERLVVAQSGGVILGIISQRDLTNALAQCVYLLGDMSSRPIGELGIIARDILVESEEESVLTVMHDMDVRSAPAAAILQDYRLVANFSASDLCGLQNGNLKDLLLPVTEFLELQFLKQSEEPVYIGDGQVKIGATFKSSLSPAYQLRSQHPIVCTLEDTLEHVIMKVVATKVHRIWVVDKAMRPLGVVTIPNLLRQFLYSDMDTK